MELLVLIVSGVAVVGCIHLLVITHALRRIVAEQSILMVALCQAVGELQSFQQTQPLRGPLFQVMRDDG